MNQNKLDNSNWLLRSQKASPMASCMAVLVGTQLGSQKLKGHSQFPDGLSLRRALLSLVDNSFMVLGRFSMIIPAL